MQKEAFADTSYHFIYTFIAHFGREGTEEEICVLLSVDCCEKTLRSFIFENILQFLMAIFGIRKIGKN